MSAYQAEAIQLGVAILAARNIDEDAGSIDELMALVREGQAEDPDEFGPKVFVGLCNVAMHALMLLEKETGRDWREFLIHIARFAARAGE